MNRYKKRKLKIIGKIIIGFFFQILLTKLINSNQQINEAIDSKSNHEKLLMKRQFNTIATNIAEVIILFLNSFVIKFFQNFFLFY